MDVTLDNSYDNGGWSIAASAITAAAGGILNRIFDLIPPANKSGYSFEWVPVAGNATGKLKALVPGASESFREAAIAEYTAYPAYTATEQAAAYAKVLDGSAYLNLAVSAGGAGYTANYQLFPDTPVAGDAVLFGGAVPFAQLGIDMSATVCVYDAAGVVGWDYWNGSAWADLDASIVYDGSATTGTTGDYFGEQDGVLTFIPPQDWAASTIDSQSAYWIKASIETGKAANITTVGLTNSTEHDINIPDTGYVATYNGNIASVSIHDQAATFHTANHIKLILWNSTTGASSGEFSFAQDLEFENIPLTYPVPVSIGDKLAIICTQEDGTNEAGPVTLGLNYSNAEALADDAGLSGVVVRCHVIGS
jgi:hypothetical protein